LNTTTFFLIAILALVAIWELAALHLQRRDLTITETIRSWGPWGALVYIEAHALLIWHLWAQRNG
jgi:uncharacterized membrane protein YdjX (TVP38/TMEM64 family)